VEGFQLSEHTLIRGQIHLNLEHVEFSAMRAQGAGGQHVKRFCYYTP